MNAKSVFILAVIFLLSGCQPKDLSESAIEAKKYLEMEGYKILSYEGTLEGYTLTEQKLEEMPHQIHWSLPGNDPEPYFNKKVEIERFKVKNHPLDNWECCDGIKAKGNVYVNVFLVDGKIAGGTSYPSLGKQDDGLGGGYWSLDGKSIP